MEVVVAAALRISHVHIVHARNATLHVTRQVCFEKMEETLVRHECVGGVGGDEKKTHEVLRMMGSLLVDLAYGDWLLILVVPDCTAGPVEIRKRPVVTVVPTTIFGGVANGVGENETC